MRRALIPLLLLGAAPVAAEDGQAVFATVCAACHAEGGAGTPGLAPPLAVPAFWQAMGDSAPKYIAGVLTAGLAGKITAQGEDYIGLIMPPQTQLDPESLAAVGTYVLGTLGGTDKAVTVEDIDAALAAPPSHKDLRALRPAS